MKYKVLSESSCRKLVRDRLANRQPQILGTDQGTGDRCVDWSAIRAAAEWMERETETAGPRDRDRTEGKLAVRLYQALCHVDPAVLDDAGFWRYLALRHFWEVIKWREPGAFSGPETSERAMKYVDAIKPTESVLTRMYLRAVAVGLDDQQPEGETGDGESRDVSRLAHALPNATDFWRSHVVRVRTGTAPGLVRAFVRRQEGERMSTKPLREFAKAINRTWTNVLLTEYSDEEAAKLLDELAETVQHGQAASSAKKAVTT